MSGGILQPKTFMNIILGDTFYRRVLWVDGYIRHGMEKKRMTKQNCRHMSVLGVIGQAHRYMIELVCTYMYKIEL